METVEYEIEFTFARLSDTPRDETVERLFNAFHATDHDADAIVGVRPDGLIVLSYVVEASDPNEAYERGRPVFVDGMGAAQINWTDDIEAIDMSLTRVTSDDGAPAAERELLPA